METQTHNTQNGSEPILDILHWRNVNFDGDVDANANANVKCEHTIRRREALTDIMILLVRFAVETQESNSNFVLLEICWKTYVNGLWMWIFEWAIADRF